MIDVYLPGIQGAEPLPQAPHPVVAQYVPDAQAQPYSGPAGLGTIKQAVDRARPQAVFEQPVAERVGVEVEAINRPAYPQRAVQAFIELRLQALRSQPHHSVGQPGRVGGNTGPKLVSRGLSQRPQASAASAIAS